MRRLIHKIMCRLGHHEFGFTFWRTGVDGRITWFKSCYWCGAETEDNECKELNKTFAQIGNVSFLIGNVSFPKLDTLDGTKIKHEDCRLIH